MISLCELWASMQFVWERGRVFVGHAGVRLIITSSTCTVSYSHFSVYQCILLLFKNVMTISGVIFSNCQKTAVFNFVKQMRLVRDVANLQYDDMTTRCVLESQSQRKEAAL